MTTAEKLKQKGKQEGKREGLREGEKKGELNTLKNTITKLYRKANLSINEIVDYLEIDKDFVTKTLQEKGLLE